MAEYTVSFKGYDPIPVLVVFDTGVNLTYSSDETVPAGERRNLEIHFADAIDKNLLFEIIENDAALSEITITDPATGAIFVHLNYNIVNRFGYENYNNEGYRWILKVIQLNETDLQLRKLAGKAVNEATVMTLDEYKEYKVAESKTLLAQWLEANPILFSDGKYYSVTEEKQALLNSNLASYERASAAEVPYPLKWNSTGEECVEWEYADLLTLSLTIAGYVGERVSVQQAYEIAVLTCEDKVSIDALKLDYDLNTTATEADTETVSE